MFRILCSILLILGFSAPLRAQKYFEFNANCSRAYQNAICLKLASAQALVNAEKKASPNNLAANFIENYIDFFILFLNEDPAELKKREDNREERLELMKQGPENSPMTLYSQAIINLQWAAVEIKFGNRWTAGWAFRDAFKLAKENQRKFPAFTPNLMVTGPMQMAAATIPKSFRWLSNMLGIKGTMQQGSANLTQFLNARDSWAQLFMNEGMFYYCYMQFYLLNKPDEALQFIRNRHLDVVNNQLFTFMAANLYLNNKQSAQAKAIVAGRNTSPEYFNTHVWDFVTAFAKLYHLEPDAGQYFERYLANFKGNFYVKECWSKLAMHYLVQGNMAQYRRCIQNTISRGKTEVDADKRALKEAKSGVIPNIMLLKARLLSDGGYQREAMAILAGKSSNDFSDEAQKLEFMYRVGRIYDEMDSLGRALQAYQTTYNVGKNRTEYFAARAALQTAMIYEKQGNKSLAVDWYKKCIDLEGHDYESSLEQKSKAGIARCEGK